MNGLTSSPAASGRHNPKWRKAMRAKLDIKDLKRMIKLAGKGIDKQSAFAELDGKVVLSVHDGKFEMYVVSTRDDLMELSQWVKAESEYNDDFECVFAVEDGAWTIGLKDLAPLNSIKKGSVIIESGESEVTFNAAGFSFDVYAWEGVYNGYNFGFPDMMTVPRASLPVSPEDCYGFAFIALALLKDTTRTDIQGAKVQSGSLISTNGYRLHKYVFHNAYAYDADGEGITRILSPKLVNFIAGGVTGTLHEAYQAGATGEAWHTLDADGLRLRSKEHPGRFPDFTKVFPRFSESMVAKIDAAALANAVKPLCAGWKASTLIITQGADGWHLTCRPRGKSKGEPRKSIFRTDAKNLPNIALGVDPSYLLDALKDRDGEITFGCVDADSPMWFGEWESGNIYGKGAIVMPIEV